MALFWRSTPRPVAPAEERATFVLPQFVNSDERNPAYVAQGETSLQSVALRATADLICSLASELPVTVWQGTGTGKQQRPAPPNLRDPGGDGQGLEDWVYRLLLSWLVRGNAYGMEAGYDRRGNTTNVDLLHPDMVRVDVVDGRARWTVNGREVTDGRLWHRRVYPVPGQLLGLSPVAFHASTISVSLQSTRFGASWFADGAHPSGILKNDLVNLSPEQAATAKQRFLAALMGTREPMVFGKGWSYESIQVPPEESQFLETMGFTEAQCARIFGPGFAEVMGYESGGSMTYSNVVDRRQDLLVLSMNKWLRRVERVLSELVPPTQWVQLNRDALLEATTLQRYQAHAIALSNRWRTVNEVRAIEDLPPVEWGDQPNSATQPAAAPPAADASPTTGEPDGNAA